MVESVKFRRVVESVTIEELVINKSLEVSSVKFELKGSKHNYQDGHYIVTVSPSEMEIFTPSSRRDWVYEGRNIDPVGIYNRENNTFAFKKRIEHVCGASGFGQSLNDVCPRCESKEAFTLEAFSPVPASSFAEQRTLQQVLYSLNNYCRTVERTLQEHQSILQL